MLQNSQSGRYYADYLSCISDPHIYAVMKCIYVQKLTQEQTAEQLCISPSTVYRVHKVGCLTINEIIQGGVQNGK